VEPDSKLPDPKVCRTRRLYTTQFFLCLVDTPVNCPHLSIIREFHICNHYFTANFSDENESESTELPHANGGENG
jgi:hypothetical protein